MLKHLVISGLTVLTLFAATLTFTGKTYSGNYAAGNYALGNYALLPLDPYYKYMHVHDMYVDGSNVTAARAVFITTQYETTSNSKVVFYRNYVRPSDRERTEEATLMPSTTPVEMGMTQTFTAPHGYKTDVKRHPSQHPIRDFRATYWLTKYYRDEFHNQASYNKAYGPYNYWNGAAPFGD